MERGTCSLEMTKREVEGLGARAIHACGAEEGREKREEDAYVLLHVVGHTLS